jgi:hypothetical protein
VEVGCWLLIYDEPAAKNSPVFPFPVGALLTAISPYVRKLRMKFMGVSDLGVRIRP